MSMRTSPEHLKQSGPAQKPPGVGSRSELWRRVRPGCILMGCGGTEPASSSASTIGDRLTDHRRIAGRTAAADSSLTLHCD
jgi:hypothetical protein